MNKWAPELRAYDKRNGTVTPIILVGTKLDIRQDIEKFNQQSNMNNSNNVSQPQHSLNGMQNISTQSIVSYNEGYSTSMKLGCSSYVECSALTQDGLKLVFDSAIKIALQKKKQERNEEECNNKSCMGACSIM